MKKSIALLLLVASLFAWNPALAIEQQKVFTNGHYTFDDCRGLNFTGTGTIKLVSTPHTMGFPGYVHIWGDLDKIRAEIAAAKAAGTVFSGEWYYPEYNRALVIFGTSGGKLDLSGNLKVSGAGAWLEASIRGNFYDAVGGYTCEATSQNGTVIIENGVTVDPSVLLNV